MTKLSIILAAVLGLTLTPFPCAEAGPPQHTVKSHGSSGPNEEDEERLIEEVLRLLGPDAGSPGQRDEDEERLLEELRRLLDPDAVESSEMSEGEEEDDVDRDDNLDHQKKGHAKKDKDRGKGRSKEVSQAGSSAGVAKGDFNGDGFADLAVGVPLEDLDALVQIPGTTLVVPQNQRNAGAVNVIYGSSGGLTATSTNVPASRLWKQGGSLQGGFQDVPEENDNFGAAVAAGDFNGDGFSDLAIAVPGEVTTISGTTTSVRGAVAVLYGSTIGLRANGNQFITLPALFAAAATESTTLRVGNALVWGDFNGDGIGDLAVEGENRSLDRARVSVLFGSTAGLNRGVAKKEFSFTNASNGGAELRFTSISLAAGKINGPALTDIDDLIIGIPFEDVGGIVDAGAVHVLLGSSTGPTTTGSQVLSQAIPGSHDPAERFDNFGFAVAVGDFDGNGIGDVAVGVPFEDQATSDGSNPNGLTDAGIVHIFFGSPTGFSSNIGFQSLFQGFAGDEVRETSDQFGFALAAGDFNGDGFIDLAVGQPGETIGGAANAGAVSIWRGRRFVEGGLGFQQFWTEGLTGDTPRANDRYGSALTAWNFGRNQTSTLRTADLAIGIPGKDVRTAEIGPGTTDAGAVRVIYGSSNGLSTSSLSSGGGGSPQLWHQASPGVSGGLEADDRFGSALY